MVSMTTVMDITFASLNTDNLLLPEQMVVKNGWAITGDLDGNGKDELIIGSNNYNGGKGGVAVFLGESPQTLSQCIVYRWLQYSGTQSSDAAGAHWRSSAIDRTNYHWCSLVPLAPTATETSSCSEGTRAIYGGDLDDAIMDISSGGNYVGRGISQDLDLDADGLSDIFGLHNPPTIITGLYGGSILLHPR